MPLVGFTADDGSGHYTFEEALALANSDAFPYPYPILKGIIDTTQNRGDYISATSILHCLRGDYLKRHEPYYLTIEQAYPMFRGTLFHSLMEKNPHPMGKVEHKMLRRHKGIEIGGTADSILTYKREVEGKVVFQVEDWKTTDNLPKYASPYTSHAKQVNLYRWLGKIPVEQCELVVWYFSMKGIKRTVVKKPMTDAEVESFLDDRLIKLKASFTTKTPLPYKMVAEDEKWECAYCPVRQRCNDLADQEQEQTWLRRRGFDPNDDLEGQTAPLWNAIENGVRARIDAEYGATKRRQKRAA